MVMTINQVLAIDQVIEKSFIYNEAFTIIIFIINEKTDFMVNNNYFIKNYQLNKMVIIN